MRARAGGVKCSQPGPMLVPRVSRWMKYRASPASSYAGANTPSSRCRSAIPGMPRTRATSASAETTIRIVITASSHAVFMDPTC